MPSKHLSCLVLPTLTFVTSLAFAEGEPFAGAEASLTRESDLGTAATASRSGSDTARALYGYLGYMWPSASQQSALIARADASVVRQDEFTALNSTSLGGNLGLFHAFGPVHSLTASAGYALRRYDDSTRDFNLLSLQAGLKQKVAKSLWFQEGLGILRADSDSAADNYTGYTLSGSINWGLTERLVVSLSASANRREYPGATSVGGTQLGVGLVQEFSQHLYLRAGYTRIDDETRNGIQYSSNVGLLAIGVNY